MTRPDTSVDQTKMVLSDIDTEALEQTTYALRATGADVHAVANADQVKSWRNKR